MSARDQQGKFQPGCKPGPGRPAAPAVEQPTLGELVITGPELQGLAAALVLRGYALDLIRQLHAPDVVDHIEQLLAKAEAIETAVP